ARGADCGEEAADDSDDDGEKQTFDHERGGDLKLKDGFAPGLEVERAEGMPMDGDNEPNGEKASEHAAKEGEDAALKQESGENGASPEAEHAESADLAGPGADGGIHGVHGGKDRADGHGGGEEIAEEPDGAGGHCLGAVILSLRQRLEREA